MQSRHAFRDDQWGEIKDALPGKRGDPGRAGQDNRRLVEAVMWIARTGAPSRLVLIRRFMDLQAEPTRFFSMVLMPTNWRRRAIN